METICLYFNVQQLNNEKDFFRACSLIKNNDRKEKIASFKLLDDKKRCLAAGLLLEYVFKKRGIENPEIIYGERGKPLYKHQKELGIYFSLSHSGDYAVIAVSNKEVGIDVEKVKEPNYKVAEKVFTEIERKTFLTGDAEGFFKVWTMKESYLKYCGLGIEKLKDFQVAKPSKVLDEVDFKTTLIDNHVVTVCHQKGQELLIKELKLCEIEKRLTIN